MCEHRPDWLRLRDYTGEIYCTVCRASYLKLIRCYCGLEYVGEHGHDWHLDKGWVVGETVDKYIRIDDFDESIGQRRGTPTG